MNYIIIVVTITYKMRFENYYAARGMEIIRMRIRLISSAIRGEGCERS